MSPVTNSKVQCQRRKTLPGTLYRRKDQTPKYSAQWPVHAWAIHGDIFVLVLQIISNASGDRALAQARSDHTHSTLAHALSLMFQAAALKALNVVSHGHSCCVKLEAISH